MMTEVPKFAPESSVLSPESSASKVEESIIKVAESTSVAISVSDAKGATEPVKEDTVQEGEESRDATPTPSVTVVLSAPKTTEELIAARALKRTARKSAVREKAEGHRRAAELLVENKNYKASFPHYLEAIKLWESNPTYFIGLAAVYRKLQWYEEAAHAATRALTLEPQNSEARYLRGVARMEQRLLKPAKIDFETVLEHDPSHFRARAALTEVTHFIETSTQLGPHDLAPSPVDELVKDVDFGFPHYDQDALEIASVSDSSDCNHVGNGVQCRFYNHEGCARGSACQFSHAPDEKSVRDDLGKNVCIYFLLDSCKFGVSKCIYSHSREALPKNGWWTSAEQIAKVKSVIEVAEKQAREQRQLENERWRAHVKALKAAGRPPKSAGIKAKKGEKQKDSAPNSPAAEGGAKTPAEATKVEGAVADEPKEEEAKKEDDKSEKENTRPKTQKRKPQAGRKKKAPTAQPTADSAAAPSPLQVSDEKAPAPATTTAAAPTAPGFTDYQLNVPPAEGKPIVIQEVPITLTY